MSEAQLTRLHAHEMAALLRSGELSSRALTEAHLAAAERQNRALNAWLVIGRTEALAQADAADERIAAARRDGPAAMAAMSENPDLSGKALPFVGLAEGICLWGFIVALMILSA